MKTAENVVGRWRVKWAGPVRGARGMDAVDGTLSEALLRAAAYVHAGSVVDVVDVFGGPTVTMGGQSMTATVAAAWNAAAILWPAGNVDAEWESDTIEDVARALDCLRPPGAEATGAMSDLSPPDIADGQYDRPTLLAMEESVQRDAAIGALESHEDAVAVEIAGGKVAAVVGPNGARVERTTVTVVLDIDGIPADALHVVDAMVDSGFFQDAINDHDLDAGQVHVASAVVR